MPVAGTTEQQVKPINNIEMKILIRTNFVTATKAYKKGETVEVEDQEGLALIDAKLADKAAAVETATSTIKAEKATQNKK